MAGVCASAKPRMSHGHHVRVNESGKKMKIPPAQNAHTAATDQRLKRRLIMKMISSI